MPRWNVHRCCKGVRELIQGVGCYFWRVGCVGRNIQSDVKSVDYRILEVGKSGKFEGFWIFYHSVNYFFSGCWWGVGWNIHGVKYFSVIFYGVLRVFNTTLFLNVFFWECQHGVGERVSVRGAVTMNNYFRTFWPSMPVEVCMLELVMILVSEAVSMENMVIPIRIQTTENIRPGIVRVLLSP